MRVIATEVYAELLHEKGVGLSRERRLITHRLDPDAAAAIETGYTMYGIWVLGSVFTVWMAVECWRRGQASPWLWVILFFGPIGSAVYFFAEVAPTLPVTLRRAARGGRPGAAEERRAGSEARRLDKAALWTDYARILRERGKLLDAVAAAEQAVAKDREDRHARYELGVAQLAVGRPADAARSLAGLEGGGPGLDGAEAAFLLAQARLESGDVEGARELLERLAARSSRPRFLLGLASVQSRQGDDRAARETLQRILDDAEYLPKYARREARPWLRKARQALKRLGPGEERAAV